MKSSPVVSDAGGRPPEIEEFANRLCIHPAAKFLVSLLVWTPATPNQVSIISVFAAAAAAASFAGLQRPWGALVGLAWLFVWHVLDGADGDLARRTGRASAVGELIDGVCDHTSQALIYVALAVVLHRSMGGWAGLLAFGAALSHTFQANAYEAGRKTYRHWVYGAAWMRQRPDVSRTLAGAANRLYLGAAALFSPNEAAVEAAMERAIARGPDAAAAARATYRTEMVGLVKRSGLLGATGRSLAAAVSLLAGSPLWFFLYEIVVLNAAMVVFVEGRRTLNLKVAADLGRLGPKL